MYRFFTTALAVLFGIAPAWADNYTATAGSGLTFAAKAVTGTLYPWWIPADSTGAAFGVTGNPFFVTNNGTFAVQATLQAAAATAIGKVDPNTIGSWGLQVSTQNSATPTNGHLALAQFNTSPTTITTGNVSPLQMDNAGNLLVNIKAGAGSGGTAIADNSVFTLGTTNETPIGCYNGSATTTAAHVGIVSCTAAGSVHTTVDNTNANGQATMANSSPVVIASNQAAFPVTVSAQADPCFASAKSSIAINQNGTSSVQLVALSGSTVIYVCSLALMTNSTATTVAFTTGTGTACVTGNAAVIGSTTANIANSMNLIAGAGLTYGNGGGTIAKGAASSELCMILGTNVFVSGNLTYVQQ